MPTSLLIFPGAVTTVIHLSVSSYLSPSSFIPDILSNSIPQVVTLMSTKKLCGHPVTSYALYLLF